jgi:hypothetical protein
VQEDDRRPLAHRRAIGLEGDAFDVEPEPCTVRLDLQRSVPPEWPHFDRPVLGSGVPGRDLNRLVQAAALDDVEPADYLLGLGERTISDDRLPVADAD